MLSRMNGMSWYFRRTWVGMLIVAVGLPIYYSTIDESAVAWSLYVLVLAFWVALVLGFEIRDERRRRRTGYRV